MTIRLGRTAPPEVQPTSIVCVAASPYLLRDLCRNAISLKQEIRSSTHRTYSAGRPPRLRNKFSRRAAPEHSSPKSRHHSKEIPLRRSCLSIPSCYPSVSSVAPFFSLAAPDLLAPESEPRDYSLVYLARSVPCFYRSESLPSQRRPELVA